MGLSGSDDEKSAISAILDKLEEGVHVRQDGLVFDLNERVVKDLKKNSCHPLLVSLWKDIGFIVLEECSVLTVSEAENIHGDYSENKALRHS